MGRFNRKPMSISIQEFLNLRSSRPVVDVRSENEFASGHIPGAVNLPLLNNSERIAVGTDYKQKGKDEAIRTGFRLVGPRLEELVKSACALAQDRELIVHCWRGGMRSRNFCVFAAMAGVRTLQVKGGYKAWRQLAVESFSKPFPFMVIGGKTGSGKSDLLRALATHGEQVIDLEALANHKGSAFGGLLQPPQPTTEQFQNDLFDQVLKLDLNRPVWIEDESIAIGKIFLPDVFWRRKRDSPVIRIELDNAKRVDRLVQEYGPADRGEFLQSMEKVTKKLGGQNFNQAKALLEQGDLHGTIAILLTYYDKAYMASLDKKNDQIIASVEWDGVDTSTAVPQLISIAEQAQRPQPN